MSGQIIERLRAISGDTAPDSRSYRAIWDVMREAADALERAERVVAAARKATDVKAANDAFSRNAWETHASLAFNLMREALAAYDAGTNAAIVPTRADTVRE